MRCVERNSATVELLPVKKRNEKMIQLLYIWRFRPAGLAELEELAKS